MEQSDLWIDMFLLILERPESEEWILMIHKKATEILVQFGRADLKQVWKGSNFGKPRFTIQKKLANRVLFGVQYHVE